MQTTDKTVQDDLTFDDLVELEPELGTLLREVEVVAKLLPPGARFCANACWYGYHGHRGIKPRLTELVGWGRPKGHGPKVLGTPRAYSIAYDRLYQALP